MQGKNLPWDHEIRIALPPSYGQADQAYPVFWVTDGHYNFDKAIHAVAAAGAHVPEMIIVAIGPPPDALNASQTRRAYDFTSKKNLKESIGGPGSHISDKTWVQLQEDAVNAGVGVIKEGGGAADFLSFLADQLRPALSKKYRMSDVHVLYGFSGGGIFCGYTLVTRPSAFDKYICGSATLYFADSHVFELEKKYAQSHDDLDADVFFSFGELEITQDVISGLGIASATTRMAEILSQRDYPSLNLYVKVFSSDDHGSAMHMTLYWGLRAVWGQ